MRTFKLLSPLFVLVVLFISISACGGDDSEKESTKVSLLQGELMMITQRVDGGMCPEYVCGQVIEINADRIAVYSPPYSAGDRSVLETSIEEEDYQHFISGIQELINLPMEDCCEAFYGGIDPVGYSYKIATTCGERELEKTGQVIVKKAANG